MPREAAYKSVVHLADGRELICFDSDRAAYFVPLAARWPYEARHLYPMRRAPDFTALDDPHHPACSRQAQAPGGMTPPGR